MRIALLSLYAVTCTVADILGAYYVQTEITTWIGVWEPVAAATLLIVVIGRGMTSPDRPRSFIRSATD